MSGLAAGIGWLTCIVAWWVGAFWGLAALAAILYTGVWLRGVPRVACLLAAAALVSLTPGPWGIAIAAAALLPFWAMLGGRIPWQGMLIITLSAGLVLGALYVSPWQTTAFASDVATRGQILVIAVVGLLLQSLRSNRDGASTLRRSAR